MSATAEDTIGATNFFESFTFDAQLEQMRKTLDCRRISPAEAKGAWYKNKREGTAEQIEAAHAAVHRIHPMR
ncbi:MAG TPA: hypothetical protein VLM36_10115 [Sphingomicrobium sp.]|nr:hypothetical protein [Sphingomicrobium sp.]